MHRNLMALLALGVAATAAFGASAAPAQLKKVDDLPILVDKYHAIKNPAGPVTVKPGMAQQLKLKNQVDPSRFIPPNGHIEPQLPGQ